MSGPELITLGCRLNIAESEAIRAALGGADDLVIVNSCAVTNEAVVETRKAIRRAARRRPEARIVVTGCASEIDRAAFEGMAEVSHVVANAAKTDPALYLPTFATGAEESGTPDQVRGDGGGMEGAHARAFIAVQNGCDHACTFCIIPQGRGPSRSLPAGAVVEAVRAAVEAGRREVVLTGVDVTAYGADLPGRPTLGMLVERVLRLVPELPRLRLSSLDPQEMDDRLIALFESEPRLMPHLHLSLQAGHDMILKRMKRRHTRAQAIALVARLKAKRPDLAIGADVIAGFPTETEEMFADSLALIEQCEIVHPHIFPFSPREGTPAARMPQLPRDVVRDRTARLREAGSARRMAWLRARIGGTAQVLVERDGVTGHAEDFARVRIAEGATAGAVHRVRITGLEEDHLVGVIA
ncbi:tRNA (N(6)-L-threonylcarbamoyladenosine(37)-C(2))-methylthiotransferase MtaB [Sphingomonas sp. AP4-R1]|uniref:tRNA (N(6)-L-threonylcarbamoyladenosine(37)-C(2))- methylthiotransferase MtaB n=1 Tax=Sphingomonas sp. AP4-R1 TaxID=2735134 RepID=UPI001493489F|nr:tRNA (N(6)-L-threonylcarbamoyladenosine(37)-C(2))-methylthiotransferase MtaB [Sphingomonas sp. AP4-R1]QJU57087.1 tRNA (N(6)-L-threonylcarbamoyladenosine(37)-C(2))-methylthiotransferase MtaB [Sphingomonas sp. AP4-R1]